MVRSVSNTQVWRGLEDGTIKMQIMTIEINYENVRYKFVVFLEFYKRQFLYLGLYSNNNLNNDLYAVPKNTLINMLRY